MNTAYEMMRHALGVQEYHGSKYSKPYRNHFCAGDDDAAVWRKLVADGLAKVLTEGSPITGDLPAFACTEAGEKAALAGLKFGRRWGRGTLENP